MMQLAQDRRALLRYLLQDVQARGRDVLLPVGCSDYDEWLLDALSVERLLKQLRAGAQTLDLINACTSSSTSITARREVLATPPRGNTAGEEGGIVDFRTLMSNDGTPGASAANEAHDEQDAHLPQLRLKSLQTGLQEYQLKELAYAIFLSCAGAQASPGLLADLRASLELSETRSAELQRIITLVQQRGVTNLASLEMHIKLLQIVRPSAFDSFRNFVKWRDTVTSVVWLVLSQAVRDTWQDTGSTASGQPAHNGSPGAAATEPTARTMLARLKGGLRRLDVRAADDYDDSEYGEAAEAVFAAADALASRCSTGWSFPWGLRARLAELLLRAIFDTLEEGQYSDHRKELLGLLQGPVWQQLRITADVHNAVFAWVHFRQFAVSQELLLLEVARQAVQAVKAAGRAASPRPDGAGSPLLVPQAERDAAFPGEVTSCISRSVCEVLSNYHATVDDARVMKGLVGVLEAAEAACGRREGLPQLLEGCIAASVEAAFETALQELSANVTAEEDLIALLAAGCQELFKKEVATYSPLLAPHQPAARCIAARTLHEVFGAKMLPWLIGVNGLTKAALEAIRASLALEELLSEEWKGGEAPAPWGTMERLSPLLYTWAQGQISMLNGWLDRILSTEDWARVTKQRAHGSRSVVETIKIVSETLEALFDMRLAIPAGVVRCLTEGVDLTMQKYCEFVQQQVGSPEALIPPRPPLTRYKRELAVAAEQQEAASAGGGSQPTKLGKVKSRMESVNLNWLPPLGATEEERRVTSFTYDSLVVRLNSVQHLLDSLAGMERMVVERWDDGRPQSAKVRDGKAAYDWIAGMFDGAKRAAWRARDHLAHFVAVRLVYGELRDVIFERLYRFHVQVSRIDIVLQEVDRLLGDICGHVHDAMPPHLARFVCAALVNALQSVMLDGGPYRLFTPQDVDMLESDMAQMRAMFYADSDGIPLEQVDALCRPLSDIVDLMQLDTGLIIQSLKQAQGQLRHSGKTPEKSPRGTPPSGDPAVLLRILCHRADHAASKYLKKDHKIPKKMPSTLSASVSDVAHKAGGLLRRSRT